MVDLIGTGYRFLIQEQWDRVDFLVFALFNTTYDHKTAHHASNLPVAVFDFSRTKDRISVASPMLRKQVNDAVSRHHNLNGWDVYPPYFADHTDNRFPSYTNPRDMIYVEESYSEVMEEATKVRFTCEDVNLSRTWSKKFTGSVTYGLYFHN